MRVFEVVPFKCEIGHECVVSLPREAIVHELLVLKYEPGPTETQLAVGMLVEKDDSAIELPRRFMFTTLRNKIPDAAKYIGNAVLPTVALLLFELECPQIILAGAE